MKALFLSSLASFALVVGIAGCSASSTDGSDETTDALSMGSKPWDDQAEAEWSAWVRIGEARASGRCTSVNKCLNDPRSTPSGPAATRRSTCSPTARISPWKCTPASP